jgi:hypothetical protein
MSKEKETIKKQGNLNNNNINSNNNNSINTDENYY